MTIHQLIPALHKNTKIMGQEFSTKSNEQRYAERYATKYSRYFYGLGFIGLLLSFGGYMFRHDMPDGMYRSTAVIQFVVATSILLLLLYMKGTSSGPFHPLLYPLIIPLIILHHQTHPSHHSPIILPPPGKHYHGVYITGATGTNADLINGWYEPTDEMYGGMCVYVKVGDNDTCLEYNDNLKKWQVKPVDCKVVIDSSSIMNESLTLTHTNATLINLTITLTCYLTIWRPMDG